MAKQNTNSKQGFTIIEVVLVLAIAGLIFLMVFIALPALQRSQRDTQRRDDMARFLSQLNQYQANNAGQVPAATKAGYEAFRLNYLKAGGDSFADPSTGEDYAIEGVLPCTNASDCVQKSTTTVNGIYVYTNAKCNGENPEFVSGNRKIAITIKLEGAGIYCGNN